MRLGQFHSIVQTFDNVLYLLRNITFARIKLHICNEELMVHCPLMNIIQKIKWNDERIWRTNVLYDFCVYNCPEKHSKRNCDEAKTPIIAEISGGHSANYRSSSN